MRLLLLIATAAMPFCAYASTTTVSSKQAVGSCMATAAAELGFNGIVYARQEGTVVEETFGTSDAAGRMPITHDTRFNIGSAGKMFTAMAIARLVDRGAVQLDAPISRYLKNLKPEFTGITVRQLLNHTSGLGDYFNPANKAAIDAAATATDLLPLVLATPPAFTPGAKRAYSNSGFVVLGAIIETVSGTSYSDFVQREIIDPLGMAHTRLDAQDSAEPMTRMSPNGPLDKPVPSPLRQLRASPAGGIFSTVSDISLFLTALTDERLVKRDTLGAFLAPRPDPGGGAGTYGYGFVVHTKPELRVGHGGGAPGVNAEIALYPESGWQLIALSNNDPPVASRMVSVLQRVLFATDPASACTTALKNSAAAVGSPPSH